LTWRLGWTTPQSSKKKSTAEVGMSHGQFGSSSYLARLWKIIPSLAKTADKIDIPACSTELANDDCSKWIS